MSRDDRDQPGGHPNRHPGLLSCLCCPATTKRDALGSRSAERRHAIEDQLSGEPLTWSFANDEEHVFLAGRCMRCHIQWLDSGATKGSELCPPKDQDTLIFYSTSTAGETRSSHQIAD